MTPEQFELLKARVNGDKSSKRKIPYEENMQMQCIEWFDRHFPRLKPYLHHSPNGGHRTAREGAKFKRMGTRKGFPDLIFLVPVFDGEKYTPYHCIEMKYGKGRQEPEQKDYEQSIKAVGGDYRICRSLDEFKRIIYNLLYRMQLDTIFPLTPQEIKELELIYKTIKQ